ncbi:hypothetical protein [Actinoplanes sp. N902-109]|uniref:hypothetical protein n=1 Tax=Actinoplanes sp. (strain N902-109) TaxID=649831 RepID=UPI00032937C3|nr:hypothetical protein [Actinoplanes sp. N902-109]AGL16221.1 hypothetical protein L083_2711 [Actinoplanes sp. N902-109]
MSSALAEPTSAGCVAGEGLASSIRYLQTGLQAVTSAAEQILACPPPGDAPGVPGVAVHTQQVRDNAGCFLDALQPRLTTQIEATTSWSGPAADSLQQIVTAVCANDGPTATAVLGELTARAAQLSAAAAELSDPLSAFDIASDRSAGALAQDITMVQQQSATDTADQAMLAQQAASLRSRIKQDHKWELLGWLAGPLGHLAAQEIGSLVTKESELQAQITRLEQDASADAAALQQLAAVTDPLRLLSQGAQHLAVGSQGLQNSWAVLIGLLSNLDTALRCTTTDPPIAFVPDLITAIRALRRLSDPEQETAA